MRAAAALFLVALAACASKDPSDRSDWEKENEGRLTREVGIVAPELPAYPANDRLVPFFVSSASDFKFFIDPASLSIGTDRRVVRYTLVARSPAGADNVSYEGINCVTNEYIIYAYGSQGGWVARPAQWRQVEVRSVQRWHNTLRDEYFCPNNVAIGSADEGVAALRRGGHPQVQSSPSGR